MRRVALIALVSPLIAIAHGVRHPRTITLNAGPPSRSGQAQIACIRLTLDPAASDQAKRLFDRDRDGQISEAERLLLESYLRQRAIGGFTISCGGRRISLSWTGNFVPEELRRRSRDSLPADLDYLVCGVGDPFWEQWGDCTIEDGGDSEGHAPITARNAKVEVDLPKSVGLEGFWDLPAHKPTKFRISTGR